MESVDRSTIWPYDEHGEPGEFFYARFAHPAGKAAEARLGELEGGDALLYASGMGAETAVVLAFAESGTTIALAASCYYGTSVLFRSFERWGLNFVEYDQTGEPPEADIVWVESPANPSLTLPNWQALRDHPGLVVCDATASTPVYLRALDEGADVVVHSASKYLTGPRNALLGATVTRDPIQTERLRTVRTQTGATASPDAASALSRGLHSLEERMRQHTENATEIAARLAAHPGVKDVRYPGFAGLLTFNVDEPRSVETRVRLITNSTSLGGVASTMESRHRWEGDRVAPGLLRLSVGLEDCDAIWADLTQALEP